MAAADGVAGAGEVGQQGGGVPSELPSHAQPRRASGGRYLPQRGHEQSGVGVKSKPPTLLQICAKSAERIFNAVSVRAIVEKLTAQLVW